MSSIFHYVNLGGVGGLELAFAAYVSHPNASVFRHHLVLKENRTDERLISMLRGHIASQHYFKRWGPIRLPRAFHAARLRLLQQRVDSAPPSAAIFWGQMADPSLTGLFRRRGAKSIYYEHGAGWASRIKKDREDFLGRVDGAICVSLAAVRMLQLRWKFRAPVVLCPNGLHPRVAPSAIQGKVLPDDRPFRLGLAGRMAPLKAHCVAVATLSHLRDQGYRCELHFAGNGPEMERLRTQARSLGVGDSVVFRGAIGDMTEFYQDIDLLLCPSVSESFGLTSIEAAAWGCPVVASRVDGLPETVDEGVTGYTVPPTLALHQYPSLGGTLAGIPPLVYDPDTETLREPRIVDAAGLAERVIRLIEDRTLYEAMSARASAWALDRFRYERHVGQVNDAIFTLLNPRAD